MNKIITLNPKNATELLFGLPFTGFLVCIILASLFTSITFLITGIIFILAQYIYVFWWRFYIAKLMYDILPIKVEKIKFYYRFFIYSHLVHIAIPLIIYGALSEKYLLVVISMSVSLIIGLPLTYFQCNFIAKVISINFHDDLLKRKLWPLDFTTIAWYPLSARKVHSVIIKVLKKKKAYA